MTDEHKPFDQDKSSETERLQFTLEAAGIGTWELDPGTLQIRWDNCCKELYSFEGDNLVTYQQVMDQIYADDRERTDRALKKALDARSDGQYDIQFRIGNSRGEPVRWLRSKGRIHVDKRRGARRLLGMAEEVTQAVEAQLSQQQLAEIIDKTPYYVTIANLDGSIRYVNPYGQQLLGLNAQEVTAKNISDFFSAEDFRLVSDEVLPSVLATHQWEGTLTMRHLKTGKAIPVETISFALMNPITGQPSALVGLNRDLRPAIATQQRQQDVLQELQNSEAKFRSLIEEAPVATCLLVGRDLIIEVANKPILDIWGKGDTVMGKPLVQALPELQDQSFVQILDEIYASGQLYQANADKCDLFIDGQLKTFYFNFTYKPLFNSQGQVYAIMSMAVDVTQQVVMQQHLLASESRMRSIIAAAPAAMGLFVGRDLVVEMPNQAFIDIVGKGPDIVGKPLAEVMPELESQPFLQILDDVFTSGKMFQSFGTQVNIVRHGVMTYNFYNITYTPLLDADGKVYAILDIAIDVTERMLDLQRIEASQLQLLALLNNRRWR